MKIEILLIEDEPAIADNARYALETEGFHVTWSPTGLQGLELCKNKVFQFLILDVGLPDINGFELCREIRRTSNVPILFLTARSEEVDRIVGLEIGADDYMAKPFSPRELGARVRAILRRSSGAPEAPKPSKNPKLPFSIDEERFQIRFHNELLPLSRTEFRILKVLIERPGRVFSRDQLMDLAWDSPESSMDRTVDAHIKTLRAKLKKIRPEEEPIQTHRGLGYSLQEYP